jgi:multicomponent Na+:H+ antiporter subunit G
MMLLGGIMAALALAILLVAALGVVRLPDALTRQHAATKAGTLAVSLFTLGTLLWALGSGYGLDWVGRLLVLLAILFATLPLASHALGRAAAREKRD